MEKPLERANNDRREKCPPRFFRKTRWVFEWIVSKKVASLQKQIISVVWVLVKKNVQLLLKVERFFHL